MTLLDGLLPHYDQREHHDTHIAAPPARVWAALDGLRVRDLPLTTLLSRVRGGPAAWFGGRDEEGYDARALDRVAPRTMLADPPHELVLGDIARYTSGRPVRPPVTRGDAGDFRAFTEPGWTKVAMNFRFTAEAGGTRLSTETRVLATDPATRRTFRWYWLAVRAGSGVVRRDILFAARAAATRTETGQ